MTKGHKYYLKIKIKKYCLIYNFQAPIFNEITMNQFTNKFEN